MRGSERFTQRASTAITKAHDAALGMGHSYVGTEHLLLGIIREGELVFQDTLEALHGRSRMSDVNQRIPVGTFPLESYNISLVCLTGDLLLRKFFSKHLLYPI